MAESLVGRAGARQALTSGRTFLTFGGGETYLLFQQGFPLREFCAFEVVRDAAFPLLVVERSARGPAPRWPAAMEESWNRGYGETALHFAMKGDA